MLVIGCIEANFGGSMMLLSPPLSTSLADCVHHVNVIVSEVVLPSKKYVNYFLRIKSYKCQPYHARLILLGKPMLACVATS